MDLLWNHLQALGSDRSIFELAESWSCLMSIMLFSHLVWSRPPPSPQPRRSLFTLYYSYLNRCTFASAMWITLWLLAAADYCWFWNSIPFRLSLKLVLDLVNKFESGLSKTLHPRLHYTFYFFIFGGQTSKISNITNYSLLFCISSSRSCFSYFSGIATFLIY